MKYVQRILYLTSFIISVNSYSKLSTNKTEEQFARIMGGYRPKEFIYAMHIISLRLGSDQGVYGSNHLCGGAIISEKAILTAAHCLMNIDKNTLKRELKVIVGSTDRLRRTGNEQVFKVRKVIPHPVFDARTGYCDIALLLLKGNIVEDGVTAMRINLTDQIPVPGQECIFLGWGGLTFNGPLADELVYMNSTLLPFWHCALFNTMVKGVICLGEFFGVQKVAGNGDSGGPLICDGKLVGVASYIVAIRTYFTSVYTYREWILANSNSQSLGYLKLLKILLVSLICILIF